MAGGTQRVRDGLAACGWAALALWGFTMVSGADYMRTEPGVIRGDEKAVLLDVSGALLIAISVVLLSAVIIRRVLDRPHLAPAIGSVVLGWSLVGLFVVFCVWGVPLTAGRGIAALAAYQLPYLIAGVCVLFARRGSDVSDNRPLRRPTARR